MLDPGAPEPGYRLKLRRAEQHLKLIAAEGFAFAQHNFGPAVPVEPQPEDEWTVLYFDSVTNLDPMWSTYMGDFLHNARCALDHLLCALIRRHTPGARTEHAQFPIYDSEAKWIDDIERPRKPDERRTMADGVSPDVLAELKTLQPYHLRGSAKKKAPLVRLLLASNADKHRDVYVAAPRVASREIGRGRVTLTPTGYWTIRKSRTAPPGTPIETGAERCRLKIRVLADPPPDTEMYMHVQVPIEVAFRIDGKDQTTIVHTELWDMLNEAWRIVLRLEAVAGIHGLPTP